MPPGGRAQQAGDHVQAGVQMGGAQELAPLVGEPPAQGVVVDHHREAAVDGHRGLPAAVDQLLAAISFVPREEQEPAVREPGEVAQAADRGEWEEQGRILQALRVLPQDGVELRVAVGLA